MISNVRFSVIRLFMYVVFSVEMYAILWNTYTYLDFYGYNFDCGFLEVDFAAIFGERKIPYKIGNKTNINT